MGLRLFVWPWEILSSVHSYRILPVCTWMCQCNFILQRGEKVRHLRYNLPLSTNFAWRTIPRCQRECEGPARHKLSSCSLRSTADMLYWPRIYILSPASSVGIPKLRPLSPKPSCDWLCPSHTNGVLLLCKHIEL